MAVPASFLVPGCRSVPNSDKGRRGSKNPKILRTSNMDGPKVNVQFQALSFFSASVASLVSFAAPDLKHHLPRRGYLTVLLRTRRTRRSTSDRPTARTIPGAAARAQRWPQWLWRWSQWWLQPWSQCTRGALEWLRPLWWSQQRLREEGGVLPPGGGPAVPGCHPRLDRRRDSLVGEGHSDTDHDGEKEKEEPRLQGIRAGR